MQTVLCITVDHQVTTDQSTTGTDISEGNDGVLCVADVVHTA